MCLQITQRSRRVGLRICINEKFFREMPQRIKSVAKRLFLKGTGLLTNGSQEISIVFNKIGSTPDKNYVKTPHTLYSSKICPIFLTIQICPPLIFIYLTLSKNSLCNKVFKCWWSEGLHELIVEKLSQKSSILTMMMIRTMIMIMSVLCVKKERRKRTRQHCKLHECINTRSLRLH